jgi:hypothetical protein
MNFRWTSISALHPSARPSDYSGNSTWSITWMMPFVAAMSVCVTAFMIVPLVVEDSVEVEIRLSKNLVPAPAYRIADRTGPGWAPDQRVWIAFHWSAW